MLTQETVFSFLKDSILELKDVEEEAIKAESALMDFGLDSLDFVEVQVMLKRKFAVQINPVIFANGDVRTLADFSRHVVSLAIN